MSRNPLDSKTNDAERMNNFGELRADSETMEERIEDVVSKAKDKADAVAGTINQQRENLSSGLDHAASTLHEQAAKTPSGPRAVNAAHRLADSIETTASYLRQHDFADMRDDLLNVCRRYPVQALISAVAVGFLLSRSVRR
jgi:methyl-accepting chemotaxis protein